MGLLYHYDLNEIASRFRSASDQRLKDAAKRYKLLAENYCKLLNFQEELCG
jgi:hypothetical protein